MMHYPDPPYRNNENAHPGPAARSGLLPSQRPVPTPPLIDEATTEVPVIRKSGTLPPHAEESDAQEDRHEPEAAETEPAEGAEAQPEATADTDDDEVTRIAPWADLTGPAPTGSSHRLDIADDVEARPDATDDVRTAAADADEVDEVEAVTDATEDDDADELDEAEAGADAEDADAENLSAADATTQADDEAGRAADADPLTEAGDDDTDLDVEVEVEIAVEVFSDADAEDTAPVAETDAEAETGADAGIDTDAESDTDAEKLSADQEGTDVLVEAETTTDEATAPASAPPGRPGDVAEEPIAVWSEEEAQRLREEWRDLQVLFIDDPGTAVTGAKRLVTDAVNTLSENLLAEQDQFDPHQRSDQPDTEAMRVAMRRYREFLDRVLAL